MTPPPHHDEQLEADRRATFTSLADTAKAICVIVAWVVVAAMVVAAAVTVFAITHAFRFF